MKNNYKTMIIGIIIAVMISVTFSYALAETIVNSKDIYYKDNSNLLADNVQDAIDGTCTKFESKVDNFLDKIYPIGSIYISATLSTVDQVKGALGGTWEAYGKGQTLVGIDTSQTEFNTIGKTGGAKSISYTPSGTIGSTGLTINQIPSHSHTYDKVNANTGSHVLTIGETPEGLAKYAVVPEGTWSLGSWAGHGGTYIVTMKGQVGYGTSYNYERSSWLWYFL